MGAPQAWRANASPSGATSIASFTSNRAYVAFVDSGSICVGRLDSPGTFEERCSALPPHAFGLAPILALSPLRTGLLAISAGSRTSIWDIVSDTLKYVIHASERSVTSSAWSHHDPDLIALGHIDGHVSLWNLDQLTRPKHVWSVGASQCHLLSWSTAAPSKLAACCGQTISICDSDYSRESHIRCYDLDYRPESIFWRPNSRSRFMTISPNGIIEEWSTTKPNESLESSDDEDQDLFGDFEDLRPRRRTPIDLGSISTGSSIYVLGDNAVLVLAPHGRSMRLYKDLLSTENDESIWDKQLMGRFEYVVIIPFEDAIDVIAVGSQGKEKISIPAVIRGKLSGMSKEPTVNDIAIQTGADHATADLVKQATMQPIPLSATPKRPHKTHTKQRTTHSSMRPMSYKRPPTNASSQKNTKTHAPVSPRQAMASSLELPKLYDEQSPMPFLSPTIPSQRPSPIPTLSDDITLPPPENESFGSLPSTAIDESDSDDETFDGDDLKGSGTLMMPGGANVPLPKSCGAFFSPNGQLITYFPPKAKAKSADIDGLSSSQPEERSTKASRLFPLFGNLAVEAHDYEDSDTDSLSTETDATSLGSPKAEMFSFSTPGEPTWTERLETLQALPQHTAGQQTVIVSIRDVSEIIHFRPVLARSYQLSCNSEDAAGDACINNAKVARSARLDDLANVWNLLALIFHDELPEDLFTGADVDITKVAQRASRLIRTASGTRSTTIKQPSTLTAPYLSRSKVGAAWLVSQIYAWTELRADVQMLACVSAVLLSSAQSTTSKATFDSRFMAPTIDYFVDGARHNSHSSTRPAPDSSADVKDGNFLNHTTAKQPRSSQVSSRDPSQPTTPYVDSLSSTPPFPFPKLSRQGSRLSASGSASPEHHRSSFGAAAKFYAQSITDKISSYGTSPPARRFGTSPNNELSSSLPGAVSWSKSVSFASGVDHGSRSSIRIAPDDDGYDSDRTIEDNSLPQTPKRYGGPVSFNLKNAGAFLPLKEAQPYTQPQPTPLLSPPLAAKARIWMGHYSEQLRRMDLQVQAAELDNIARQQNSSATSQNPTKHHGMTATAMTSPASKPRKAICSLCYCKIQGVQQVCTHCLHTTHISCLREFASACDDEDDMECPTGCGCVCSLTAYHETVWDVEEEASAPVAPAAVRRKWSFTDPRRWREQVQGDSW